MTLRRPAPRDLFEVRSDRAARTVGALDGAVIVTGIFGVLAALLMIVNGVNSDHVTTIGLGFLLAFGTWLSALSLRWGRDVLALLQTADARAAHPTRHDTLI